MSKISFSKEELSKMIFEDKLSYEEIGRKCNVSGSGVRKYAKSLGINLPKRRNINPKENFNKGVVISSKIKNINNMISDEEFLRIVKKYSNISDIEKVFGYNTYNIRIRKYIRSRCDKLGIKISHSGKILLPVNNYDEISNFSRENIKLLGKISGIYMIENNYNHHKYIGQSINIKRRLLIHISEKTWDKYNNYPLYKAFKKYGIKAFSFRILSIVEEDLDLSALKKKLDSIEKFYIKKYNTYNGSGYNQTIGGDAGILGYKMTEEQVLRNKENKRKLIESGKYILWYYNTDTKEYDFGLTSKIVGEKLEIPYKTIRKCGTLIRNKYITARTKEELEKFVEKYNRGNLYSKN